MLPENEKLIRETERLLSKIKESHDFLKKNLPPNDIRLSFLGLTGNVLHSLLLHYASIIFTIGETQWWLNHYNRKPNNQDLSAVDQLSVFSKHAFFVFFFSRIETLIRKSINLISPNFDPKGIKSFKVIYDEYFKKLGLESDIKLFDISRLIRNTIHSNGVFISGNGNNRKIYWQDKEYKFTHKVAIDFMTTDEFFYLIEQLIESIVRIINTEFFNDKEFVEDKYY